MHSLFIAVAIDACFDCLPPYARMLTMNERNTYSRFLNALRGVEYTPLKEDTIYNARIVKWVSAFNSCTFVHKYLKALLHCQWSHNIIRFIYLRRTT